MLRATPLLAAVLFLSACGQSETGPEADPCDPPSDPAPYEVGTGEKCFERLAAEADIPLINGPQGGYHLWLAVGCEDCGDKAHLKYGARSETTEAPLPGTYVAEQVMTLQGDSWGQVAGIQLAMPGLSWDEETDPPPAKGTRLFLWADVVDGDDALHHAEIPVVIGDTVYWDDCDEGDNSESCAGNEL